ncbi:F-box only protein 43 [Hydra vulgaris]|uniref:F-box only protein 43 n=1 Tax=Hydra vulgaris TaxID=6087 RepID=A0ABM4BS23_HYDVU
MAKTPELASASFMYTPPFSDEVSTSNRFICNIYKEKPPSFCLDDVDDNINKDKKVDFLKELLSKSMISTVCKKILDSLADRDLLRASHVSSTWRSIIRYVDIKSGRRMNRFLKKLKRSHEFNKENRECVKKTTLLGPLRLPLLTSNVNVDANTPSKLLKVESNTFLNSDTFLLTSKDKYKQCPECQSPSKISYQNVGHCTKCNTDFCIHCFYSKEKHSPTCQVMGGPGTLGSPRKLTNAYCHQYSINAKDNKVRLKRL